MPSTVVKMALTLRQAKDGYSPNGVRPKLSFGADLAGVDPENCHVYLQCLRISKSVNDKVLDV